MTSVAMIAEAPTVDAEDDQYTEFLAALRARFDAVTASERRLFTTDAADLFGVFLAQLPPERRQHYTCNACRRFVERFGGLVTIAPDGVAKSVMWDPLSAPWLFRNAVRDMRRAVERAKVTGIFLCDEPTWGMPSNKSSKPPGVWRHMFVVPSAALVHKPSPLKTTVQAVAEKLEEYGILRRGLGEFSIEVVRQAHALLTSGNLYRSEKCIGVAKWLLDLHEDRAATKNNAAKDNLVWLAVSTAPTGFCHVRTSMIGTLLEDVAAGLAFSDIKSKFDTKMNPLQYQRPQAAPSAGNIAQAEKVVAELASAGALERRFAKLEDIQALWKPKAMAEKTTPGGVFGHLKAKTGPSAPAIEQPAVTMTWDKFQRTVLPEATCVEFYVPSGHASYGAMVTAANLDAPPILQWDRMEKRNQVSWYFYQGGSLASQWNMNAGTYRAVTAIALQPSMWDPELTFAHQGRKVFFLLEGARDLRYQRGAGFFPETLRNEYHGIRATMEAYARGAVVVGAEDATACGIALQDGVGPWNHLFRVTSSAGRMTYKLDRWD